MTTDDINELFCNSCLEQFKVECKAFGDALLEEAMYGLPVMKKEPNMFLIVHERTFSKLQEMADKFLCERVKAAFDEAKIMQGISPNSDPA